ncbi:sugar ABC transporter substrate-binding protein [Butyricicoccus sp.]|uniref:sugar ABC transporter substrate-binding protein n=1 Tax=Butyricicoccus sp. TaxID=2049021 RepID=UPI003F151CE8
MKKRFMSMAMAGVMCAGMLAGCGSSSDTASSGSGASGSSDDAYNISVIVKLTDGHFNKVIAGAKAYADEHDNVNVEILSPTSATAYDEQTNMIETSLGSDYDAVIISPQQSAAAATQVANTDKVIVALDTDFESDKKSSFVGTGNKEAAKSGGVAAVEAAKAAGVEKPTAVILTGVQGDETHDARLEGYTEGVEEAGGEVLEVQYCDALAEKAATATEGVIQKYPEGVDIILSTNDDMVMAAVKVVQDSDNAAFKKSILCGFDGNQAAIEAIQEGTLAMDVAQLGYDMGYKAVEAAVNVLEGKDVESFVDSGAQVVSTDNVDEYVADMKDKGLWED